MLTTTTRFDRFELKFVISARQRAELATRLAARMERDPFADAAGRYPVVSLYFDNPARDIYLEQVRGVGSRRKLRVRVYGGDAQPPVSFVEIKHKLDGRTVKRRALLPVGEAMAVCAGDEPLRPSVSRVEDMVVEEARTMVRDRELEPVCLVRYDREALRGVGSEADLRVTFDDRIRYRLDHLVPHAEDRGFDNELLAPDAAVLEVKVDHSVPFWLAEALGDTHCVLQSHSKYCQIMERHGLPAAGGRGVPRLWWELKPPKGLEAIWTPSTNC